MELVIDIPDNYDLSKIQNGSVASKIVLNAIANGTPLPKGHGDLKDMEDIYEALEGWSDDTSWIVDAIDCQAPTILEADKESEEE